MSTTTPTPEHLIDELARMLTHALRELANAGQPTPANKIAGQAWASVRNVNPQAARRINGAMHYIARLEGEGGVGRADATDLPVIRTARITATEGNQKVLVERGRTNARDALAAGALSAEVYETEGGIVVVSRWDKQSELEEFLSWHETQAHETLGGSAAEKPQVEHLVMAR